MCVACGAELAPDDPKRTTIMPPGGAAVPPASAPVVRKVFCPHCGAPVTPGVAFCGRCGEKVGE
ncbi:MAG: zinc ribbon domain-containing protein [Deltaproteobacteria bacterium]|nr:zinc ribbon domain-containing protein [Deltaproteobacteria bacterium]